MTSKKDDFRLSLINLGALVRQTLNKFPEDRNRIFSEICEAVGNSDISIPQCASPREKQFGTHVSDRFALFERECRRLEELWGITGWGIRIYARKFDELNELLQWWASTSVNSEARTIDICYNTREPGPQAHTEERIKRLARHEMIHALLAPKIGLHRWTEDELGAADFWGTEHEVLFRLMKLLPE